MNLIQADKVEILIIIDNYADSMLEPAPGVKRREIANEGFLPTDTVLAEHGVCLLITAWKDDKKVGVIFDAGFSPVAAPRNIEFLNEPLDHVQALAISHAHEDHIGATSQLLQMAGNPPLHVHPICFHHPRYWRNDNGTMLQYPDMLNKEKLMGEGATIIEKTESSVIGEGLFLLTGQIPRHTDFEHALPGSVMEVDGEIVEDIVLDDQAVVLDVAYHGLVVLSGCGHAGIINTINYARELTNGRPLYTVMGGFHLPGSQFKHAVAPTIEAIKAENPAMVVPMHCTGTEAKAHMRFEFGSVFVDSAVGTRIQLPF